MKLSSRQQLLNESEMTLKQIKKSLNEAVDTSKLDAIKRIRKDYIKSFNTFMQVGEKNEQTAETIWNSFLSGLNAKGKTIGELDLFTPTGAGLANNPELNNAKILSIRTSYVQFSYKQGGQLSIVDYSYKPLIVCKGSIMIQFPDGKKKPLDIIYNGGDKIFIKKKSE